jgi:hypothetical protein
MVSDTHVVDSTKEKQMRTDIGHCNVSNVIAGEVSERDGLLAASLGDVDGEIGVHVEARDLCLAVVYGPSLSGLKPSVQGVGGRGRNPAGSQGQSGGEYCNFDQAIHARVLPTAVRCDYRHIGR